MKRTRVKEHWTMKREYDFSKGVRGRFYRKGAELRLPIYLDAKLQEQVERLAQKNGKDVGEMVNQLVRKEVEVIEEFT
jgi:cytidylate kinase